MSELENAAATPAMSRPTEDSLVDYESFNIFALAGLLLSIASAASLIDYLFWLLPAAGTLMSLFALWQISHSDRRQVGRPLAIVGLCLSLFFLFAAPTSALVEQLYIRAESRAFADRWFEYLRHGDRMAAYDMTINNPSRSDADNTKLVDEEPMWAYYDQNRWPQMLLAARDNATAHYIRTPFETFNNGLYVVRLRYDIRMSKDSIAEPFEVLLEREKDFSTKQWHWRIVRITRQDEQV